jgi:hypothetical protein
VVSKIPQRVYFSAENLRLCPQLPAELPEMLYAGVARRTSLVRVFSEEDAHAQVRISCKERMGGGYRIEAALYETGGGKRASYSLPGEEVDTWEQVIAFVEASAERFAPEIVPVTPEVRVVERAEAEGGGADLLAYERSAETQRYIRRAEEEEARASRLSYGVWTSGLRQHMLEGSDGGGGDDSRRASITPVILNVNYFPHRRFGYRASLYLHYDTVFSFGEAFDPETKNELPDPATDTRSLFLLPGLGVQYRTLGPAFAVAGFDALAGAVFIENPNDYTVGISNDQGSLRRKVVGPNSSTTQFYSYLSMHLSFGYNVSERYGFALRTALNFFPGYWFGIYEIDWYELNDHSLFLQLFSFGFEYRP